MEPNLRLARATAQLMAGQFEQGWPEYEWRCRNAEIPHAGVEKPQWDGGGLAGKRILLRTEQGLGDALHFIRYADVLAQRGATVLVQTCVELVPILSQAAGVDTVCVDTTGHDWDVEALLLSLPWLTETTLATVPNDVPYLHVPDDLVDLWRHRLAPIRGLRVGLVWRGEPHPDFGHQRSIPLELLSPLAGIDGVQLICLHHEVDPDEAALLKQLDVVCFEHLDTASGPFMDTAAIMLNLDLVVSCDTSLAHLAGGLGMPVVALPQVPEWRYMLDREDSPWYPRMRLFRQSARGDWTSTISRLAHELSCRSGFESQQVTLPVSGRARVR